MLVIGVVLGGEKVVIVVVLSGLHVLYVNMLYPLPSLASELHNNG